MPTPNFDAIRGLSRSSVQLMYALAYARAYLKKEQCTYRGLQALLGHSSRLASVKAVEAAVDEGLVDMPVKHNQDGRTKTVFQLSDRALQILGVK
jgi:hypothetical protein